MSQSGKRLVLIGSVIGLAILTWRTSYRWLEVQGQFGEFSAYVWPLMAVIVFTAAIGLALMLLTSRWDRLALITASWATFALFFPPSVWYVSALPVFLAFWMGASRNIHRELEDRHTIRVWGVIGAGTRWLLLGTFLMVSLGFYSLRTGGVITLNTVSSGIRRSVDSAYDSSLVRGQLADLPPSLQAQVRRDVANYIDSFVRRWLSPLVPYLPPLLAFLLFLVLWSVVGLVRFPVLWLASGLFALMKTTGFVSVREKDVKAEVVTL